MITIVLAALSVISLTTAQQTVVQPSTFPLSGFYQPLTFPTLPNTNVYQPQQQQYTTAGQQQQPTVAVQQPATSAFHTQSQLPEAIAQQQAPQPPSGPAAVVNTVRADGTYAFGYQTPDGQMRAESVQADGTTRGSYTYRTPEGQLVTINYTAGRHGFQTSPGTTVSAGVPAAAAEAPSTAVAAAPAPAAAPSSAASTAVSGISGTPLVLYTAVPQVGLPAYYPFNSFGTQSAATSGSAQSGALNADAELIQTAQTQTSAAASVSAASPAIGNPVGFSYGSNPQAIQQLQRLLLV